MLLFPTLPQSNPTFPMTCSFLSFPSSQSTCTSCLVLVAKSCRTLQQGILQGRILEWVGIPFSRGSSWPRDRTWIPSLQAGSLPSASSIESFTKTTNYGVVTYSLSWVFCGAHAGGVVSDKQAIILCRCAPTRFVWVVRKVSHYKTAFWAHLRQRRNREEVGNQCFRTNILMLEIFALYSHGQNLTLKVRLTCLFTSFLTRK